MRRVLIVTGSYAPAMIADMHRARQLAWRLPDHGWAVDILCPDESYQPLACLDDDGAAFFAPDTPVHAVPQLLAPLLRALNIGSIGMRAILPAMRAGQTLLRRRRYDLVYVSTAQFLLFLLGPAWRRQFGVPYVLDLHDPVHAEAASRRAHVKHWMGRMLSKHVEATAVRAASGLISVSPAYLEHMRRRYAKRDPAWLGVGRQAVIPFAVLPRDLEEAARTMPTRGHEEFAEIIYVGTGGPIMLRSFSLLCRALSHLRARRADLLERVRIKLFGTASALGGDTERHLAGVARAQGLADVVDENPTRVTYRRSLELLLQADGALILGVNDAGYMPSKLFTYAYSGKPILASLHRGSPALSVFREHSGFGHAMWFDDAEDMPIADAAAIAAAFLEGVAARRRFDRSAELQPFSAGAMARRHAEVFEACLRERTAP